jgi:hypothetical protein
LSICDTLPETTVFVESFLAFWMPVPYFVQRWGFYNGTLQIHFPYNRPSWWKNKSALTASLAIISIKIIDYWNFAPGVDMDSSFGLRPKPFILGSFLSRKYQFQKIYHVAQ